MRRGTLKTELSARLHSGAILIFAASSLCSAQDLSLDDTVHVWAQKRPTTLQDVPMSVSTLTAEQLLASGITDLSGAARALPVLHLQSSVTAVTTTLRIRRIGNLGNIPTFEPAVGLFVDGAFRSRSMLGTSELLDVERIEVLHGPQSTLYGKNASAGVLAIYTRKPAERFSGTAEVAGGWIDQQGSPGLARAKGAVSGPLSSSWRAAVAGAYSWRGRTMHNAFPGKPDGNEQSRTTFRGQLLWSPHERLEVRLLAGHLDIEADEGESDVYLVPGARSTGIASSLQQLELAPNCPDNAPHDRTTCSVATNELDLEASDVTLIAEYELANGWQLISISGWDRYKDRRDEDDAVQLFTPLLYFHDSERGTTFQEELRLVSGPSALAPWLVGVFWYDNEYERGSHGKRAMFGPNGSAAFAPIWQSLLGVPMAIAGQNGSLDSRLHTDYLGVFGQFTLNFNERLTLTAGARWQQEEKRASMQNSVTQPGASLISTVLTPTVSPSGAPVNGTVRRQFDAWTWSVTPQYRFDENVMVYATVARGAKSGGFNTGFGNAPLAAREFDDERIDNYEIGARARFANGRARASAAAFYTRYHDYQDAAFIAAQFTVGNADRADLKGVEIDGSLRLGMRTSVDFAASYAELVYDENTTGMCYPGRAPDGSLPGSCDLSGEHPVNAPKWATHLGIEHTVPLGSTELFSRVDWSWSDEYDTSFSADPRLQQESFHDVALRIGVRAGTRGEIVLSGENLLNEKMIHFDSVLNFFNDASFQSYLDDARRYSLTLRAEF